MSTSEVVAEVAPAGTEDSKAHAEAAPKKEERRKSPSLLAKLLAPFKNEKTKIKKKVKTPKSPKEKKEEQPEAAAPAATAVEEAEPSKEEATAAEAAPEVPTEIPKEEKEEKAPKAEVATQPKVDEHLPKIDEPTPIAPHLEGSPETQTIGVGGTGGKGGGFNPPRPLTSIDEARKADVPDLDADTFCTKYHLDKEICDLLNEHGFETAASLLEGNLSLKELRFKVGHIAELTSALKTMLWETLGTIWGADAKRDSTPAVSGGTGGGGGYGGQRGGGGGLGGAARISIEDVYLFREIWGGIGGVGGPGGKIGLAETSEEIKFQQQAAKEVATTSEESLPALFGGIGGAGGPGTHEGGRGGLGEADHLRLEEVSGFRSITGGRGGQGGDSFRQGGYGGTGQGSAFSKKLYDINDDTRRRVAHTRLEDFSITPELRTLLQSHGFRTVGGLLEAYDTDVAPPAFKAGHMSTLKSALRKFVVQKEKEQLAPLPEGLVNPSPDLPTPDLDKAKASRTILITQRYSRGQSKPTYFGTVGNQDTWTPTPRSESGLLRSGRKNTSPAQSCEVL